MRKKSTWQTPHDANPLPMQVTGINSKISQKFLPPPRPRYQPWLFDIFDGFSGIFRHFVFMFIIIMTISTTILLLSTKTIYKTCLSCKISYFLLISFIFLYIYNKHIDKSGFFALFRNPIFGKCPSDVHIAP